MLHGARSPTQQAQDRTAPILPIMPGAPEIQTHGYVRDGTTTLFAALEDATGHVEQTGACPATVIRSCCASLLDRPGSCNRLRRV